MPGWLVPRLLSWSRTRTTPADVGENCHLGGMEGLQSEVSFAEERMYGGQVQGHARDWDS